MVVCFLELTQQKKVTVILRLGDHIFDYKIIKPISKLSN